jgi:hypothetical protein
MCGGYAAAGAPTGCDVRSTKRIAIRLPGLAALQARLIARLPPTSKWRRANVARSARLALQAYNRRDVQAVV